MINLFTGLSQNQINSYEKLIDENVIYKGYNVLITNFSLMYDEKLWDRVVVSPRTFDNKSENVFQAIAGISSKVLEYKGLIHSIKEYRNSKEISLYFTYIEDVLNNNLLFNFNKNIRGFVVEDGTLNYYDHTIKNLSRKKVLLKWLISNVLGVPFVFYEGHSSGIDYDHVLAQYVRSPLLSVAPNKSLQLPYNKYSIQSQNSILIIGQEAYINMFGKERYESSMKRLMSIVLDNNDISSVDKVYYKPHRHGKRLNYELLYSKIDRSKLEILDGEQALEELFFENLRSNEIYGFDSSALLNIYLEMGEKSRKHVKINVLLNYNTKLESIFKKFNFNIFK